jgi:hypothetical protein
VYAVLSSAPSVGGKAKVTETQTHRLLALKVVVEPDADGDGFGDETQDKCPSSALASTTACPSPGGSGTGSATPALKIKKVQLEGNTVAVKLTTTAEAAITVTGSVKGKPAAKADSLTVKPGETGRAYLPLTKATRQKLAKLPRKQHINLVIEVKSAGAKKVSSELALQGRKKKHRPRRQH